MRIIVILLFLFPTLIFSQEESVEPSENNTAFAMERLLELTEKGIELTGDSIKFSKEFIKLSNDAEYRELIYPEAYTWAQTHKFLTEEELKKAFWYMINLYPESQKNKEVVIKTLMIFDEKMKMDDILVNTFNTYCYADPEVSDIINGDIEIIRPDIFEAKIRDVKEIVGMLSANKLGQEKK